MIRNIEGKMTRIMRVEIRTNEIRAIQMTDEVCRTWKGKGRGEICSILACTSKSVKCSFGNVRVTRVDVCICKRHTAEFWLLMIQTFSKGTVSTCHATPFESADSNNSLLLLLSVLFSTEVKFTTFGPGAKIGIGEGA